ncbi:hypothetical protein BV20DRAFT_238765 [Pilatotrama ljubarskyi]|nr:hypothetical protein BV20DRAFT_238765 [Pilatotrama ljubarskyi]
MRSGMSSFAAQQMDVLCDEEGFWLDGQRSPWSAIGRDSERSTDHVPVDGMMPGRPNQAITRMGISEELPSGARSQTRRPYKACTRLLSWTSGLAVPTLGNVLVMRFFTDILMSVMLAALVGSLTLRVHALPVEAEAETIDPHEELVWL